MFVTGRVRDQAMRMSEPLAGADRRQPGHRVAQICRDAALDRLLESHPCRPTRPPVAGGLLHRRQPLGEVRVTWRS